MDTQIVAVYALSDDLLRALCHYEDPQCQMSDAEVMTTAVVAALFFGGNFELARGLLKEQGYIPTMLSKSRFCRRLHRIKHLLLLLFELLGDFWKAANKESLYIIDTFPIAVCDNMRISRARRYRGEAFRGYQASKRRYFYGLKVHLMVTYTGQPVEFFLTPGSVSDTPGLDCFAFDLPVGSRIFGDKAYNYYTMEDTPKALKMLISILFRSARKTRNDHCRPGCAFCKVTTDRQSKQPVVWLSADYPSLFMRSHRRASS